MLIYIINIHVHEMNEYLSQKCSCTIKVFSMKKKNQKFFIFKVYLPTVVGILGLR